METKIGQRLLQDKLEVIVKFMVLIAGIICGLLLVANFIYLTFKYKQLTLMRRVTTTLLDQADEILADMHLRGKFLVGSLADEAIDSEKLALQIKEKNMRLEAIYAQIDKEMKDIKKISPIKLLFGGEKVNV